MEKIANGSVTSPDGFMAAATTCGLKESGALDLAMLFSDRDCTAAGIFTRNRVAAAPVILDRETLASNPDRIRAVVANAGIANACTGTTGMEAARATQRLAADALGVEPDQILVLSTGVIGVQLDMLKMEEGIRHAASDLSPEHGPSAAQAIMTTDTRPKEIGVRVALPGGDVTIAGMAKGSGMIHPDMATMLSVLTTDADISPAILDELLRDSVDLSFNRISVDGDTSTNDTVLVFANGASGVTVEDNASLTAFREALNHVCLVLAQAIIRDGEGVTKFITLQITGATDEGEALRVARAIATSPLVKTAFAGGDPNWGRILAAAGRAGVNLEPDRLTLWIGEGDLADLQLVRHGTPTAYNEPHAAQVFAAPEIAVCLDLGMGNKTVTLWTCDLTHEYININSEYRT